MGKSFSSVRGWIGTMLTLCRFVLQLISLAGLHSTATITNELSKAFKTDGMLAYVNLVQRREKEIGCDVLTHQKWSGASLVDGMLGAIQSGSSGSKSMGEGNTETSKFSFSWPKDAELIAFMQAFRPLRFVQNVNTVICDLPDSRCLVRRSV